MQVTHWLIHRKGAVLTVIYLGIRSSRDILIYMGIRSSRDILIYMGIRSFRDILLM